MPEPSQKLLLIGWDAADWQIISPMMERGELPHLERLVNGGVMAHLAAPPPVLSPLLWTSIATGVTPDQHGIIGFSQLDSEGKGCSFGSADRMAPAIWEILSKQGLRTNVVNWPNSHPADPLNGTCVSDRFIQSSITGSSFFEPAPLPTGAVYPPELTQELEPFRVAPGEIDADQIRLFIPRLREVDQTKDPHLRIQARCLAESFTTHAVTTWLLEHRSTDFLAVCYRGIAHCSDAFMRFYPPKLAQVSQHEFELYSEVVSGAYRLHDLFLGRLLQLAGPDTTVILCSDHGYYSDHLRPPPMTQPGVEIESCHRPTGIFVARGTGFQKDVLIHGASVLDITPTILQWYDLPIGHAMGRPLAEAFVAAQAIQTIASWGESIRPTSSVSTFESTPRQQAGARGLEARSLGSTHPVSIENQWNLVRVHLGEGHLIQALPLIEELYEERPLRQDFAVTLAECLFRLGLRAEAAQVVERIAAVFPSRPISQLCQAFLDIELRHQTEAALSRLGGLEHQEGLSAVLWHYIGLLYLRLNQAGPALAAFNHCLKLDTHNSLGLLGLTRCHLHNKNCEQAAVCALQAVGLNFSNADAHFYLGVALADAGQFPRALQAFEQCLHFAPMHLPAQRYLIRLGAADPNYQAKAAAYRNAWQARSTAGLGRAQQIQRLRQEFHRRAGQRRLLFEAKTKDFNRHYGGSEPCRVRPAQPADVPPILPRMPLLAMFGAEGTLFIVEDHATRFAGCVSVFAWSRGEEFFFDFLDDQGSADFILGFVRRYAAAHEYRRLVPLRSYAAGSPEQQCLERNGFSVVRALTKLEVEIAKLWLDFDGTYQKLLQKGKVPEQLRIVPLSGAPYLPVRDLLTAQVGGNALLLDRQLASGHFCSVSSKVACIGPEVVGVMLAHVTKEEAEVDFTAVQPGPLRSSLYVMLGRALLAELRAKGVPTLRLSTYNTGIIKSVRRAGGNALENQLHYGLDLRGDVKP